MVERITNRPPFDIALLYRPLGGVNDRISSEFIMKNSPAHTVSSADVMRNDPTETISSREILAAKNFYTGYYKSHLGRLIDGYL